MPSEDCTDKFNGMTQLSRDSAQADADYTTLGKKAAEAFREANVKK
jgi:hypothetical protein